MSSTLGKVKANEFYPTPCSVVNTLLSRLTIKSGDRFLEPCRGNGAIYDKIQLPESHKSYAEITEGIDYLNTSFDKHDIIITNPPFSLTEQFLDKSMSELSEGGTLAYLQRVNFLGSKKRINFWERVGHPGKFPIIVPRPRFLKSGSDSCEYAWFIWDHGNRFSIPNGICSLVTDK